LRARFISGKIILVANLNKFMFLQNYHLDKNVLLEHFGEVGYPAIGTAMSAEDVYFEYYDAKHRAAQKLRLREILLSEVVEPAEREFIIYRFWEEFSIRKCAEKLEWSKSKTERFEKKVLLKLRELLSDEAE
jgi:DNA-directed RNA polymerase specialized sigma24 family protein